MGFRNLEVGCSLGGILTIFIDWRGPISRDIFQDRQRVVSCFIMLHHVI